MEETINKNRYYDSYLVLLTRIIKDSYNTKNRRFTINIENIFLFKGKRKSIISEKKREIFETFIEILKKEFSYYVENSYFLEKELFIELKEYIDAEAFLRELNIKFLGVDYHY